MEPMTVSLALTLEKALLVQHGTFESVNNNHLDVEELHCDL